MDAPPLAGTLPSQIVSMRLPGVHSGELAAHLQRQNVHISARGEGLRISPHFYNTVDDVEAAVRAMRAFLESGK